MSAEDKLNRYSSIGNEIDASSLLKREMASLETLGRLKDPHISEGDLFLQLQREPHTDISAAAAVAKNSVRSSHSAAPSTALKSSIGKKRSGALTARRKKSQRENSASTMHSGASLQTTPLASSKVAEGRQSTIKANAGNLHHPDPCAYNKRNRYINALSLV